MSEGVTEFITKKAGGHAGKLAAGGSGATAFMVLWFMVHAVEKDIAKLEAANQRQWERMAETRDEMLVMKAKVEVLQSQSGSRYE